VLGWGVGGDIGVGGVLFWLGGGGGGGGQSYLGLG